MADRLSRRSRKIDFKSIRFIIRMQTAEAPSVATVLTLQMLTIAQLNFTGAHFLQQDISAFDAPFFSISPEEAKSMDPQQRLLLEVVYEGFENAGIPMSDYVSSKTACFVGAFTRDYETLLGRDDEKLSAYQATGNGMAMLANRISWFYDLKGPSISVDTACSSSLTAFHLACQSLRQSEADMVSFLRRERSHLTI